MEIKTKDLKFASYAVAAQDGVYNINANVTIDADGAVINVEGGNITREDKFVASFGKYGDNMNVNYSALTLEEKNAVNGMIEDFLISM